MNAFIKASLISGLATFVVCLLSIAFGGAFVALLLITVFPGPVYAIILLLYSGKLSSWKVLSFLLLTMAIYYSIIYSLNLQNFTDTLLPYKIFISGILGAVTLKMLYDFVIQKTFQVKTSVIMPFWLGAKASLLSSIFAFGFQLGDQNGHFTLISIGLLSIFPLWQYWFSVNLLKEKEGYS